MPKMIHFYLRHSSSDPYYHFHTLVASSSHFQTLNLVLSYGLLFFPTLDLHIGIQQLRTATATLRNFIQPKQVIRSFLKLQYLT